VSLVLILGTWGTSFVFVKLISGSMHPCTFAGSRGFIATSTLLVWLASRSQAPLLYNGMCRSLTGYSENPDAVEDVHCNGSLLCAQPTLVAVARKPRAGERS
jgi:hypothetical protein